MSVEIVVAASASVRIDRARRWLSDRLPAEELYLVGATNEAPNALVRSLESGAHRAQFGWKCTTLPRLAASLATSELATRGLTLAAPLALEAVCARVVDAARDRLGRFQPVSDRPGLVRALSRTLQELRLSGIDEELLLRVDAEMAHLLTAYRRELEVANLADRADLFAAAAHAPSKARPVALLDLALGSAREADLVASLCRGASSVLATVPTGDVRSLSHLRKALGVEPQLIEEHASQNGTRSLARLQHHLFERRDAPLAALGDDVIIVSAPGESRECVEIARRIHREAERGVAFDRMTIALRAPAQYRPHLEEALRRAGIPAHFARGTMQPDPAGRAFLALLSCAAEQLSARRFAEYLSLGQVPDADAEGAPPPAASSDVRFAPPDVDLLSDAILDATKEEAEPESPMLAAEPDALPVQFGGLRSPRRWERLLVEAAVIGGRERWRKRLDGLRREIELDLEALGDASEAQTAHLQRTLSDLASLRAFALPMLDAIEALPERATWGEWCEQLSRLASRALRRDQRVQSTLAELSPMAAVGPVDLHEVRLVLGQRLRELMVAPTPRAAGKVYVAPIEALRGLSLDVVFVPGLAERVFPQKVIEDPILRDEARLALSITARQGAARQGDSSFETTLLETNDDRVIAERLALRLAVGAAGDRLVVSYPRLDAEQSRPRVPSFYGLELLRAAEGRLTGFDELTRRAEKGGAARIAWPAPADPMDAIDEAEHDLAVLAGLLHATKETRGPARFLLEANPHLGRALKFRARRWIKRWSSADGLVEPLPEGKAALTRHALSARSYSATALQHFASCPYKFYLQAVVRLAPREVPESIEEMNPLQRGSLVHEVQYELFRSLQNDGLLPLTRDGFERARQELDRVLDAIARKHRDELCPAIDRVWDDGITAIRADLRDWLERGIAQEAGEQWTPFRFEFSAGLPGRRGNDPHSQEAPVTLDCGIQLRGSIDLVEKNGAGSLRATDYKTGKARVAQDSVVSGGTVLQPVLYALALEKLFPQSKVEEGRLYYCTSTGGFTEVRIRLDSFARNAATEVATIVGAAIDQGFLPAAPSAGACEYCEYQVVCGPNEEHRTQRKARDALVPLRKLRSLP